VESLELVLARDRDRLRRAVEEGDEHWPSWIRDVGWDRIVLVAHRDATLTGRRMTDIAAAAGEEPFDTMCRLLLEDPAASMVGHGMTEEDVREILAAPDVMVASDGTATSPDGRLGRFSVHPRYYGTFPRVLGPTVREGVLTLEAAVRKMTSLPAERFGLGRRGRVVAGWIADLVVFDPARITDRATYEHPHVFPDGVDVVIVGGRVAWNGTEGVRAGRVIRRER
jgi:N-acyl-D-amino-acid deacylase